MRIQRHVVTRKSQWLVALPAEVRAHLGLVGGATVYWHTGTKGRVTLTTSGRVRGGRASLDADCPACAKYRAEVERLRRELREGEAATPGQHWRAGYNRATGDLGPLKWDLSDLRERMRRLEELLGGRRPPRRRRVERVAAPLLDPQPAPDPLPLPGSASGGAAASGGEAPQAAHTELATHGA